ncbi:MAG: acylphosphatase [Treponema sp.]|nr:acylphosphatase [Treponema sp.]
MKASGPSSAPAPAAFFARIRGRVQGVGFRYTCFHEAQLRGLSGWVRNTPEGNVEVWAEGPKEKLETFLQWLHRGPPGARVDTVDYSLQVPTGTYKNFRISY